MLMKNLMRRLPFLFLIIFISFLFFTSFTQAVSIDNPLEHKDFKRLIAGITAAVAGLIGGIATIMFLIAGIYFLTSAGDPGRLETAKSCLKYAIIGTVIALSAGAIVAEIQGWF